MQQAGAQVKRTTVLSPLVWLIGVLLAAIVLAASGPTWVLVVLISLLVLSVLVILCSFLYFAAKKPELLRTEQFAIQKLAIQKGMVGDSTRGLFTLENEVPATESDKKSVELEG